MKRIFVLILALTCSSFVALAQEGGLNEEALNKIRASYKQTTENKAIRNAVANNSIQKLVLNLDNLNKYDTHFSHRVMSKGISDQKSSGRCWMFTGFNVMRSAMIAKYNLGAFEFSQNYLFFYDQFFALSVWALFEPVYTNLTILLTKLQTV